MNFYALNETPINGWETQFGSGQAALTMVASGKSANVHRGTGKVSMTMAVTGKGIARVAAKGAANLRLNVAGNGVRWATGFGAAAMEMLMVGDGYGVTIVGGRATMVMRVKGLGGVLVHGSGKADLVTKVVGDGRAATGHHGFSHGIMEFRAWDIPKRYTTHHGAGTAGMRLAAFGSGNLIASNGGAATTRLQLDGYARIGERVYASGAIRLGLEAVNRTSSQHRQIRGSGKVAMGMQTSTRINRVVMLPNGFHAAPKARGMRVGTETRSMRVPAQRMAQQPAEA